MFQEPCWSGRIRTRGSSELYMCNIFLLIQESNLRPKALRNNQLSRCQALGKTCIFFTWLWKFQPSKFGSKKLRTPRRVGFSPIIYLHQDQQQHAERLPIDLFHLETTWVDRGSAWYDGQSPPSPRSCARKLLGGCDQSGFDLGSPWDHGNLQSYLRWTLQKAHDACRKRNQPNGRECDKLQSCLLPMDQHPVGQCRFLHLWNLCGEVRPWAGQQKLFSILHSHSWPQSHHGWGKHGSTHLVQASGSLLPSPWRSMVDPLALRTPLRRSHNRRGQCHC